MSFNRLPSAIEKMSLLSSPEPKAHRRTYKIGRYMYPASVRRQNFKRLLLSGREADCFHMYKYSIYRCGERINTSHVCSDKNSDWYGNLCFTKTYIYNGEKVKNANFCCLIGDISSFMYMYTYILSFSLISIGWRCPITSKLWKMKY